MPPTTVALPTAPVAPPNPQEDGTCPGDSVIGAISAATGNDWSGQWSATDGWSLDTIRSLTATASRVWYVYVNNQYLNDPPCHKELIGGESLRIIPKCKTPVVSCFTGEPLILDSPANGSPAGLVNSTVWELNTTVDPTGFGVTTARVVDKATVTSPDGSALTDYLGVARVQVTTRGTNTLVATKPGDVPDRRSICITDGTDGYCGTTIPAPIPFDPYAFCKTTGFDGYCNSPDQVPPAGRITQPVQQQSFSKGAGPKLFKGTVDFDPSQTDEVRLRLMRQTTVTKYRIQKRRVTVTRRVRGKILKKRAWKRIRKPYKTQGCLYWNPGTGTWKTLKRCDAATAPSFKADGADEWSLELPSALPSGKYTLDALAKDGAGNIDTTPELGRNRVTFKVA